MQSVSWEHAWCMRVFFLGSRGILHVRKPRSMATSAHAMLCLALSMKWSQRRRNLSSYHAGRLTRSPDSRGVGYRTPFSFLFDLRTLTNRPKHTSLGRKSRASNRKIFSVTALSLRDFPWKCARVKTATARCVRVRVRRQVEAPLRPGHSGSSERVDSRRGFNCVSELCEVLSLHRMFICRFGVLDCVRSESHVYQRVQEHD